jgi:hypothetical protein
MKLQLLLLCLLSTFLGCDDFLKQDGQSCVPGKQVSCSCPGGWESVQECLSTGGQFGPCACGDSGRKLVNIVRVDHLLWQKEGSSEGMTWSEAQAYCEHLSLDGLRGWRLPSISELRSVIRRCAKTQSGGPCGVTDSCLKDSCSRGGDCYGCSKRNIFTKCFWHNEFIGECDSYWSSSPYERSHGAWLIDFNNALVDDSVRRSGRRRSGRRISRSNGVYARCVMESK